MHHRYRYGSLYDLEIYKADGLWGIIRVHRRYRKHLKPLCQGKGLIHPLPPCPSKEDIVRRYEVVAIQKKLIYNRYGDHDPNGLVFVPLDKEYTPSMRVSLNPQFLQYDPVSDSGVNVGYNEMEQTAGAGESKRYLWHCDREYGACIIQSFGDMRNHRYHGLFGAVIVEPPGAEWYRNFTRKKDCFAEQAVITAPGVPEITCTVRAALCGMWNQACGESSGSKNKEPLPKRS